MRINHNVAALNTHRQMGEANKGQQNSMEKLSSGLRINKAGDDAAGLAISEKMRGQIRGLDQASRNSQDGISMIQTAEGALNETHDILQRMRELSVQSGNDTNTDTDRKELQKEVDQLSEELTRISDDTEFNTQKLLDGEFEGTLQIGSNEDQNIDISIKDMGAEALGVAGTLETEDLSSNPIQIDGEEFTGDALSVNGNVAAVDIDGTMYAVDDVEFDDSDADESNHEFVAKAGVEEFEGTAGDSYGGINISTQEDANSSIATLDDAIEDVSAERSKLGAVQNRLDHTINNLGTSSENLTAAESRIRDVDMAEEMMNQTKNSILGQASQAMLAQANQQPQGVLQLLQ
ncbi:flagellin [Halobacillus sp. A1]|uniref:flagellin N-terminal helical domain-containing protein n=1 Tax=Halobacillus sp. A1 TaxID=2880262 RepID=UPI0020A65A78|nr:flagellin [Halobacillus sp. A1]MCP3032920.1 flagellin [Halobacillus sp. A1]